MASHVVQYAQTLFAAFGGRALILILPIITLQLGISVVFIFEGVTEQMTSSKRLICNICWTRDAAPI
jgi:hypothetical protein